MTVVGDVMSRDLLTVARETSLVDASAAMTERRVGAALVVAEGLSSASSPSATSCGRPGRATSAARSATG